MTTTHTRTASTLAIAALAAMTLVACGRNDDTTTVRERADAAATKTENAAERAGAEVRSEAREATASVKSAVSDAAITASVNAELARDNELSALRIDVDTAGGRVALKGSAPNAEARARAARLARSVDGVVEVDNQLEIKG